MTATLTPYPLLFEPILKPKVWGGRRLLRLGKPLPPGENIGESWELADLPDSIAQGRSIIANGPLAGMMLRQAMDQHERAILGHAQRSETGGFPLLLKYLDACENLSVQVHPDEAYVRQHPGAHLKSEAWIVIDAEPPGLIYKGIRPDVTREQFAQHLRGAGEAVVEDLIAVPVRPGECHYLPSGTCHALGAGVLVAEVQTPSDTTFRVYDWGRTSRELHIEPALACIQFGAAPAPGETSPPMRVGHVTTTRLVQTDYFHIERSDTAEATSIDIVPNEMPMIWMVLEGSATVRTRGADVVALPRGSTVLMPAALNNAQAALEGGTSVLVITLPPLIRGMMA